MERSRLKSKANKSENPEDMETYRRHRYYVVKLDKQTKRNHFNQLDDKSQDKDFYIYLFKIFIQDIKTCSIYIII